MKHALPLLLFLFACGCTLTQETKLQHDPRSYAEAMDMIAAEIARIDKHMIGDQYSQAVKDAQLVVKYTGHLSKFEPPRMTNRYDDYIEYDAQVADLQRTSDRLLYMLEQRRREDCRDTLAEVAKRFNRLSLNYGPSYQIGVLERGASEYRFSPNYRSEMPGELRSR